MSRNLKCHKPSFLAPEESMAPQIPYRTWKRWLLTGRITEDRLKELGIITDRKTRNRKISVRERISVPKPCGSDRESSLTLIPDDQCVDKASFGVAGEGLHEDCSAGSESEADNTSTSSSELSSDNSSENEEDVDEDLHSENNHLLSVLNSKFTSPDTLNHLLHSSLRVTKFETLLMILHLSIKHKMTDVFLDDLLSFVDAIVPNSLNFSKHFFQKLFMFGAQSTVHFYCPNCLHYFGNESSHGSDGVIECEDCEWSSTVSSKNSGNYFLTLGLRDQIRDVLTRPGIEFTSINRLPSVISDLMDGKVYSLLQKIVSNPDALTLTMNTVGSPVFKSGPNSLWPVHFYINEIEPSKRYSADNVLLGGLWFGRGEANLQVFLKPIVDELKELEKCGVVWRKADGTTTESPVFMTCCCCDSVARPKVQHHMQCYETFGCSLCLHPNETVSILEKIDSQTRHLAKRNIRNKNKKFLPAGHRQDCCPNNGESDSVILRPKKFMRYVRGTYVMRSNKDLRENMELASAGLIPHIMGSTGRSVICDLRHFNVMYGFPIDYMHSVLLGTVKCLIGLWFDSRNHDDPYYIGLSAGRVDLRLRSVTLPSCFRPPRPISDRVHWQANEWRAFLLYYGLPVLFNILPLPFFNHFKKLVSAIYILVKDSILHDEVQEAHDLLQDFLNEYQDLYGVENMVYDVHITGHLAQMVTQMGPLWSYSTFPFESANSRLVKMAMGSRGVATQISKKYLMSKNACKLIQHNYKVSDAVLEFCCKVVGYKYLKNAGKENDRKTLLGRQFCFHLNDGQKQAFIDRDLPVPDSVQVVNRVIVNGRLYLGRETTRQIKACDSCIRLTSGEFALIDLIIPESSSNLIPTYFLVTKLNMAADPSPLLVPHIKQCSLDCFGDLKIVTCDEISRKCIFYSCYDRSFVAEIANFYELDF